MWGDQNATNGCRPDITICTDAADLLFAGDVIIIENDVTVPVPAVNAPIVYDARDNVKTTYPVVITRGAFPEGPGSLLAGSVEVHDTGFAWGTNFFAPIGINLPVAIAPSGILTSPFEYTAFYCQAKEDGTQIRLNGGAITTINKGQTHIYTGIRINDRVTSSKPIQVHIVSGDKSSQYEMRWYSVLPRDLYSRTYLAPVGDTVSQVVYVVYNPSQSASIVVNYKYFDASGPTTQVKALSIPARSSRVTAVIPTGAGVLFESSAADILVFAVVDTVNKGHIFDWGFPVMPVKWLTPQVLIGLGYGCTENLCDSQGSRSVVWISSIDDAELYIDYDNDGIVDTMQGILGLSANLVSDPNDNDMSGAYLFATEPGSGPQGTPGKLN